MDMRALRLTLLGLFIAVVTAAIVTAVAPTRWTGTRTIIVFGRGGLKFNQWHVIYPGESITYVQGQAGKGWSRLRNTNYSIAYFLRPAFHKAPQQTIVIVPYWPLLLLLGGPWFFLHRWQRLRWARIASGACVHCGYDLKGIESDRCPECGQSHGQHA